MLMTWVWRRPHPNCAFLMGAYISVMKPRKLPEAGVAQESYFLPIFGLPRAAEAIFRVVGRAGARPGGDAHGAGQDHGGALLSSHPLPGPSL